MRTFKIEVTRIGYSSRTLMIEAFSRTQAEQIALDTAGSHEFREHYAKNQIARGTGRSARSPRGSTKQQEGGGSCPRPI